MSNLINKEGDLIIKPDNTYYFSSMDTLLLIEKFIIEKIPFILCEYHSNVFSVLKQKHMCSPLVSFYDGELYVRRDSSLNDSGGECIAKDANINCLSVVKLEEKIRTYDWSLLTIIYTNKQYESLFNYFYEYKSKELEKVKTNYTRYSSGLRRMIFT